MAIFKINNQKLEPISEKKIDLEHDIQKLTERNLETVFGYQFIASELKVDQFRFDTLAWNHETKSFIIIEYKKDRNFSIVDQGFSYLSFLVNKQEFFLYEYFEHTKKNLSRDEVDWSQSRVVFISPSFTPHQINSVNFRNMAFDLYEIKMFENNTVQYDKIQTTESSESIDLIMENPKIKSITKEIPNYTIYSRFKPEWKKSRELFDTLHEKIISINPNIEVKPVKYYIGYRIDQKNIFNIGVLKSGPWITFTRSEPKDFNDPEGRVHYDKNSFKHYNQHQSSFQVKTPEDIDYAIMLIRQAYKRFISKD